MKSKRAMQEVIIIALIFSGLQTLQILLLKNALAQQEHAAAHQFETAVSGLLNKAHKTKDDIVIYEVLRALSQTPGIVQARITDSGIKIPAEPGLYMVTLEDGSKAWGNLVLSFSGHLRSQLLKRQGLAGIAASGIIGIVLCAYLQWLDKKRGQLHSQIMELDGLLQTEKKKLGRLQEREEAHSRQAATWLQGTIEKMASAMLVLDAQQHVAAVNKAALFHLKIAEESIVLKKSWQDVPVLCLCGTALGQSLASPGHHVEWTSPANDLCVLFETSMGAAPATWVTFMGPEDVVK